LLDWQASERVLRELDERGLFLVTLGNQYRYHHMFHDFLRQQLNNDPVMAHALHRRAADLYLQRGDFEEAIYHLLAAGDFEAAAAQISAVGDKMVRNGRLHTLAGWIEALPVEGLPQHPALLYYMGEVCRLTSRFDAALAWYEQAKTQYGARLDRVGVIRALQGQARVYLDTVRPLQAEVPLQEALRLVDGQQDRLGRAQMLDLLAENKLNRGQWMEAEALHRQARELREEGPGEGDLEARVRLRTGRLTEAREMLEQRAEVERKASPTPRVPRSHRETLLVLSLIYALQGEAKKALCCAKEGTRMGQVLGSPFVEAVGYIRQGHAWQLSQQPNATQEAARCYQQAIKMGESLILPHIEVEALWGLCRLYGFHNDILSAEKCAHQGIGIGLQAGDEWIAAIIGVTLGASYTLSHQNEPAIRWLSDAAAAFRNCGDPFGQTIARLWLSQLYLQQGQQEPFARNVAELLQLVQSHGYAFLFTRRTFLGPKDPQRIMPLLIEAYKRGIRRADVSVLLKQMGLTGTEFHPGYSLRLQTLGPFRAWRGKQEISKHEWQRVKARHILQLLITQRGKSLEKEQILDLLWPELEPSAAENRFKVTLNALNRALEPKRPSHSASFFILRHETAYGLNPVATIQVDAEEFEQLVTEGTAAAKKEDMETALECYRQALALYQGDYLQDCLYEDWCSEERERLLTLYLSTANKVAAMLTEQGEWEAAIQTCQRILTKDNCWEEAYRLLMLCYDRLGLRSKALQTYKQCVKCLRKELDVAPSPQTVELYKRIHQQ